MTDLARPGQPADPADDLVGRPAGGLVDDDQARVGLSDLRGPQLLVRLVTDRVVVLARRYGSASPAYVAPIDCSATRASTDRAGQQVVDLTCGLRDGVGMNSASG